MVTVARRLPSRLSAGFTRLRTWVPALSQTSRYFGRYACRKTSALLRQVPSPPAPSSTKMTIACASITAMTTPLPAASAPCASAKRCSSSALAPTLQSVWSTPSTAAVTRKPATRLASFQPVEGRPPDFDDVTASKVPGHDELACGRVASTPSTPFTI